MEVKSVVKLSRKDRVRLTHKIEDILDTYCRNCPYDMNAVARAQCVMCPVDWELRATGHVLGGTDFVANPEPVSPVLGPFTAEEDARLWELRRKGLTYYKVGIEMGRSQQSIYKRAIKIGEVKTKR